MCVLVLIRTLTSHEDLQKCLSAIKDNAFHVSDYPVIITLEDHLPPNLQAQVAKVRFIFFFSSWFETEDLQICNLNDVIMFADVD